jgi:hypothetical protein
MHVPRPTVCGHGVVAVANRIEHRALGIELLALLIVVRDLHVGAAAHIPLVRRPAKWLLGLLANRIAGQRILDLNSGLRAFRRDCVKQYFVVLSNKFSFTTTVTLALMADEYRVVYVPINYYARVGRSKIRPRHFMDFVVLVLRMAMLFQPLRVFLPLSLTSMAVGAAKVVYDVLMFFPRTHQTSFWSIFYEPVLSTSSLLLTLLGMQLLMIGLVADGVVRRLAQHNRGMVPSRAVWVKETSSGWTSEKSDVVVRMTG